MKTLILKYLISKNGFFDREKLINLSNKSVFEIYKKYHNFYFCKIYFKFLKINLKKQKIKKITIINSSKVYENAIKKVYGEINFFNKLKNKIKKFL